MLRLRTILLAHDLTANAAGATDVALHLARRTGAALHVVYADTLYSTPHLPPGPDGTATRAPSSDKWLAEILDLDAEGVEVRYAFVRGLAPATVVLEYARMHDIDLVVMGTHGRRGVARAMIGSVSEEVVRQAPCPVLTARPEAARRTVDHVLVPIDFSRHATAALQHARALAEILGARLTLLHVVEDTLHPAFYGPALRTIYDADSRIDERAIAQLRALFERVGGRADEVQALARYGVAPGVILDVAHEQKPDLIVMGTHGLTGLERFFMGSVAEKVVRGAPCPVFTLKSFGKMLVEIPQPEADADADA